MAVMAVSRPVVVDKMTEPVLRCLGALRMPFNCRSPLSVSDAAGINATPPQYSKAHEPPRTMVGDVTVMCTPGDQLA